MKNRPNISVQSKFNNKLDYLKYLAEENIQPNITGSIINVSNTKTKSKPFIDIKKEIDINKINQFRNELISSSLTENDIFPITFVQNPISNISFNYSEFVSQSNDTNISNTQFIPSKTKTKSKPNIHITNRNLDAINKHRISMINYVVNEKGICPDLLIEYPTYYILTITSYKLLFNNETPTSKDFDIYFDGLILDKTAYKIKVDTNIIITIQKNELLVNHLEETNFEIISKFILK